MILGKKLDDNNLINKNLEIKMKYAQNISSLVHSIRKKEKIKQNIKTI